LPPPFSPRSPAARPAASSPRRATDGVHGFADEANVGLWLIGERPPDIALGILVPLDALTPQRLAAALRLWRSLSGKPLPEPAIIKPRRTRLILGLRALDGRAAGASHRDLARVFFGAARVPDGPAWKAHDLRSRTLRLVADAVRLRDGGYRTLLVAAPTIALRR
jgi:hypothetical protein